MGSCTGRFRAVVIVVMEDTADPLRLRRRYIMLRLVKSLIKPCEACKGYFGAAVSIPRRRGPVSAGIAGHFAPRRRRSGARGERLGGSDHASGGVERAHLEGRVGAGSGIAVSNPERLALATTESAVALARRAPATRRPAWRRSSSRRRCSAARRGARGAGRRRERQADPLLDERAVGEVHAGQHRVEAAACPEPVYSEK